MDRPVKYFRTHHLPWSESIADDDLVIQSPFNSSDDVVVTIKMDGECLRSTTPILLSDGSVKSISQLSIGDVVSGYEDGKVIPSTVTNTFFNGCSSDDWLIVKYKDYRNKMKTIQCTKKHKFFVNGQYITADDLTPGVKFLYTKNIKRCSSIQSGRDVMPLVNHSSIKEPIVQTVELISVQPCYAPRFTGKYDIETETHNYFANGILVHNCTSLYPSGHCHARSLDSGYHESRNFVKALWRSKAHLLPQYWRVCGENLYAKHSIHYADLKSYLYVFSIWTDENVCLSWDETLLWCELLELTPVDVIYAGKYDENAIKQAFIPFKESHEGYVVRSQGSFHYDDSQNHIAKYVRKNHVQSNEHWMFQEVVPNKLINNEE